jgi:phosphoribosylformylglycinamidine synthase
MIRTLQLAGAEVTTVWHGDAALPAGTDLVAIPGGFSYGDYLRCGAIAKVGRIMRAVGEHAARGGHVLGICNGFQILTECGLLPGALTRNAHLRFECRDVFVKVAADGPFSAVGSVLPADRPRRGSLPGIGGGPRPSRAKGVSLCVVPDGAVTAEANPAGSVRNIAGIYGGCPHRPRPHASSRAHERGMPGGRRPRAVSRSSASGAPRRDPWTSSTSFSVGILFIHEFDFRVREAVAVKS